MQKEVESASKICMYTDPRLRIQGSPWLRLGYLNSVGTRSKQMTWICLCRSGCAASRPQFFSPCFSAEVAFSVRITFPGLMSREGCMTQSKDANAALTVDTPSSVNLLMWNWTITYCIMHYNVVQLFYFCIIRSHFTLCKGKVLLFCP